MNGNFVFAEFEQQLEDAFEEFFGDLSRLKGFSLGNVFRAITFILTAVPNIVPLWALASPEQRKSAVVAKVNKYIDIPFIGESIEAMAISYAYDIVFAKLGLG